jgi:hypothetical protein
MKIATKLTSLVFALGLIASSLYAEEIVKVRDEKAINKAEGYYQDVREEYENVQRRFNQEMANISGTRDLGDLVNATERLTEQLDRLKEQYNRTKNLADGSENLTEEASALYEALNVYNNCEVLMDENLKKMCEYKFKSHISELSDYDKKVEDLDNLTRTINTLDEKIMSSTNQKQSLDNIAAGTKLLIELEAKRQLHELTKEATRLRRETDDIRQEQMREKTLRTPVPDFRLEYTPIIRR